MNLALSNVGTNCPRCGRHADILDGTYEIRESKLVGLSGPEITLQVAERLRAVAKRARDGEIKAQEIIAEIAGISPELAEKLTSKKSMGVGILILILIMIFKSVTLDIKIDVNRLIDQAMGMADAQGEHPIPDNFDDVILPEEVVVKERPKSTIAEALKSNQPNRKERRRIASLQRRCAREKG